jgi:hypothetical protein
MEIYTPVVFRTKIDTNTMPELKKYDEIRIQMATDQSVHDLLDFVLKTMNEGHQWAHLDYIKPVNTTSESAAFEIEKEVDWEDELNHLIKQYQEEKSNDSDGL